MDILFEWLSFLTRWLHVMAGITWIGSSFYFNWFDSSVREPKDKVIKENIRGTLDEIHGGSFYYHEQYWPDKHPQRLLVHAWPAKTTFYSGLLLMAIIYWVGASTYLVDKSILDISGPTAIILSVASILLGWVVYTKASDYLKEDKHLLIFMFVFVLIMSYVFTHIFSGRGAFISMGVMLGSFMGLNVIRHIVPNHIAMRRQLTNGEKLDIHHGYLAKRRSQHNNYFTIPVVVCMISNHFAIAYNNQYAWLILALLLFTGWAVRHYLNVFYKFDKKLLPLAVAGALSLVIAIGLSYQKKSVPTVAISQTEVISDQRAMKIVSQHCTVCHASKPSHQGFSSPPQGIILESVEDVLKNKVKVSQQTFELRAMPIGNITNMTEEERVLLKVWLDNKVAK